LGGKKKMTNKAENVLRVFKIFAIEFLMRCEIIVEFYGASRFL
jgi:hypothetical protein